MSEEHSSNPAVADKNRYYTLHSPRVSSSPQLCWLEKVKSEGNNVSVVEDVHKVEGRRHRNVRVHQ